MKKKVEKKQDSVSADDLLFIHSKCCCAHWELVFNKKSKSYWLECEKCGKPAGSISIAGPDLSGSQCACCSNQLDEWIEKVDTPQD